MDVQRLLSAVEALQDVADELGRFNTELLAVQPDTKLSREGVATHLQMNMICLFLGEWVRGLKVDNASSDDALMSALAGDRKLDPDESARWEEMRAAMHRGHH